MKYALVVALICVIHPAAAEELWESTNFGAVTQFEGMMDYYRSLTQQRSEIPPQPVEPEEQWKKVQMKTDICESVFGSDFFRMHQLAWVKNEILMRSENNYENKYSLLSVQIYVGEYINEWVFGCLVEQLPSKDILEYFVSAPYDVNAAERAPSPIAGRFVFARADDENLPVLGIVAMAEGAAVVSERARYSVGWVYVYTRWNEKPAETSSLDPICSLSAASKLRLCSILFGSLEFKNSVAGTFEPVVNNVFEQCDKRRVSLPLSAWPVRRIHEEWVIGCISTTEDRTRITYYVSRGKEPNTIFVYFGGLRRQTIALHNFFYNVSVVDRMYASDTSSSLDALV